MKGRSLKRSSTISVIYQVVGHVEYNILKLKIMTIIFVLFWIARITIEAYIHSIKIKTGHTPDHMNWAIARGAIIVAVMLLLPQYTWYWLLPFLVFSSWFVFDTLLNVFRDLLPDYLGQSSWVDRLQQRIMPTLLWFYLKAFLFAISTSLLIYYGECTYAQVNAGLCN